MLVDVTPYVAHSSRMPRPYTWQLLYPGFHLFISCSFAVTASSASKTHVGSMSELAGFGSCRAGHSDARLMGYIPMKNHARCTLRHMISDITL